MVTRRSSFLSFVLSLVVHTRASTAAAVGLLAAVAFSSPAHAISFTLAQLDAGADFEAGGLRFDNFVFDSLGSRNVEPLLIHITAFYDPPLAGFVVSDGMFGDLTLQFDYTVTALDAEGIGGVAIRLTDYHTLGTDYEIAGFLVEDGGAFSDLGFLVAFGPPADWVVHADTIIPVASHLELRSELGQDLGLGGGAVTTEAYRNMFFVTGVPEPGAAALVLAALSALAVIARNRKSRS